MRKRIAGCLLIAAFVGLLFGSAFHMANVYMERNQAFQEREQVLIQEIHKEQKALKELLVRADTVLTETTSEQLTDPFLLVQLEQQVLRGETDQKPEPKDVKTSEDYLEEYQELTASLDYNGALKKDLEQGPFPDQPDLTESPIFQGREILSECENIPGNRHPVGERILYVVCRKSG